MKRLIASLVAVLLLVSPSAPTAAPDPLKSAAGLSYSANPGLSNNFCSTASIWEEYRLYLTAAHCVLDDEGQWEQGFYVDGAPGEIWAINPGMDLAVVRAREAAPRPELRLAKKTPKYLDDVFVAGFPFGWTSPTVFRGWVSSPFLQFDAMDKEYMILQIAGAPGNSGSSVVNKKGEVVSVIQIGWDRTFMPVLGGATLDQLRTFAEKYFHRH